VNPFLACESAWESFFKTYVSYISKRGWSGITMTIDSGWTKILKEGVPHAFTSTLGVKPLTVFIDGQINLMKADYIKTWKMFLEIQFLRKIDNAFAQGARVVVLAFDNYKHVPTAKAMTQLQRCRHIPAMNFSEQDELPPVLPENWAGAMRNRTFKTKVAAFVTQNLCIKYRDEVHRTLVVDFQDEVQVLGAPYTLPPVLQSPCGIRRGECDIKAFAYISTEGPLLIESTDGDFIPLALLQIQKEFASSGKQASVILHRMYTNTELISLPKKRGIQEKSRSADTQSFQNTQNKGRQYEYVNIAPILTWLCQELAFMPRPISAFAALVATSGRDFCMNLPNLGPKTIWKNRHTMAALNLEQPQDLMLAITRMYHNQYKNKVPYSVLTVTPQSPFEDIVSAYDKLCAKIKGNTKIAVRIRDNIWHTQRMRAHVGNTLWTLMYWDTTHNFLDPLQPGYGYTTQNGRVVFEGAQI